MPNVIKSPNIAAVLATICCLTVLLQLNLTSELQAQQKQSKPIMYSLGPESSVQPDVPQGKITEHRLLESKIYPGTKRRYYIYVPEQYDPSNAAALMVFQDGHAYVSRKDSCRAPVVMDNLIHKKHIPVMIGVFVDPGHKDALPDTPGWDPPAENRSVEYDSLNDNYVRFFNEEILPKVESRYNITKDSAGRCICGISSGGICAFTAAWQRPDKFSKVISHVGSFTNIRHGDTYPGIIRKTETKPIRVFLQDGSNDLDNQYGNWPLANQQMDKALQYKKYDHTFEYGGGGHDGNHGNAIFPDTMRWTWRGYPGVKKLPLSITAQVNSSAWAKTWWLDRHKEKLARKSKMKSVDIVLLGDSITHNWEKKGLSVFKKRFQGLQVLNLGYSSDRTEHVLWRLRNGEVEGISPKVVVLMIGTNNTGHREESPEETALGIKEIIKELKFRLPDTKILLQAIFPRDELPDGKMRKQNDAINQIIKNFDADPRVVYTDLSDVFLDDAGHLPKSIMPDFLHPNGKGYELWADAVMPQIKELMK